jgi:hypothetical protein
VHSTQLSTKLFVAYHLVTTDESLSASHEVGMATGEKPAGGATRHPAHQGINHPPPTPATRLGSRITPHPPPTWVTGTRRVTHHPLNIINKQYKHNINTDNIIPAIHHSTSSCKHPTSSRVNIHHQILTTLQVHASHLAIQPFNKIQVHQKGVSMPSITSSTNNQFTTLNYNIRIASCQIDLRWSS